VRRLLDDVTAAITTGLQHAQGTASVMENDPFFKKSPKAKQKVADVIVGLQTMRDAVAKRSESLTAFALQKARAACRVKLQDNNLITASRDALAAAPDRIAELQRRIAETKTVEQLKENFKSDTSPARTFNSMAKAWDTKISAIMPLVVAGIAKDAAKALPSIVGEAANGRLPGPIEKEVNRRLAPIDAQIAAAKTDANRLNGALVLAEARKGAPRAPVPEGGADIAGARSRAKDAEDRLGSLLAQRAADETAIIAAALAPLNNVLTTVVPQFVDTYHGTLFRRLNELVGL
jgi:hypothetical protein